MAWMVFDYPEPPASWFGKDEEEDDFLDWIDNEYGDDDYGCELD